MEQEVVQHISDANRPGNGVQLTIDDRLVIRAFHWYTPLMLLPAIRFRFIEIYFGCKNIYDSNWYVTLCWFRLLDKDTDHQ